MLIAIAIAEEIQELQSFEILSFLWLWQKVWVVLVWAGVNLCGVLAQLQVKPVQLKLLAKVKENSEAQNFNAILCNPWISSAMAMAMSIYRTLCVLVFRPSAPTQWRKKKKEKIQKNNKRIKMQILLPDHAKYRLRIDKVDKDIRGAFRDFHPIPSNPTQSHL